MVPKRFGDFSEYREVTRNPRESLMGLMGHSGEEEAGHRRCPPSPIRIGQGVGARPAFSFSLSTSFPLSHSGKGRGILQGLGSPSRTPHTWRAP